MNNIGARPWYIDSPSAVPLSVNQTWIKFVEVVGSTAGSQGAAMASITDKNGNPIITAQYQTTVAGEIQTYNLENWFNGVIVPSLGTGVTLRIHVK